MDSKYKLSPTELLSPKEKAAFARLAGFDIPKKYTKSSRRILTQFIHAVIKNFFKSRKLTMQKKLLKTLAVKDMDLTDIRVATGTKAESPRSLVRDTRKTLALANTKDLGSTGVTLGIGYKKTTKKYHLKISNPQS